MATHHSKKAIEEGIAKALKSMKFSRLHSDQRRVVMEYMNGAIFTYLYLQLALLWIFHTIVFFWRVHFPFHARSFANKENHIHYLCLLAGLIIPILPVIAHMGKFASDIDGSTNSNITFWSGGAGFTNTRFPPVICTGRNSEVFFYSLVLILDLILLIGITLLIIILWTVLRHTAKSKVHHTSKKFKLGAAEKKLVIVLCYYVILASEVLTVFTVSTRNASRLINALERYFFCEQGGRDPENLCDYSEVEGLINPALTTLSFVLLGLLPLVNLLFVVNLKELKEIMQKWCVTKKTSFYKRSTATTTQNESTKF